MKSFLFLFCFSFLLRAEVLFEINNQDRPLLEQIGIAHFDWSGTKSTVLPGGGMIYPYQAKTPVLSGEQTKGYLFLPVYAGLAVNSSEADLSAQMEACALRGGFQVMLKSPSAQKANREFHVFMAFKKEDWELADSKEKIPLSAGLKLEMKNLYSTKDAEATSLQVAVLNDGQWYVAKQMLRESGSVSESLVLAELTYGIWDPETQLMQAPRAYGVPGQRLQDVEAVGFLMRNRNLDSTWTGWRLPNTDAEEGAVVKLLRESP